MLLKQIDDLNHQLVVQQVACRNVHGNRYANPDVGPSPHLRQRKVQHVLSQGANDPGEFGKRNELIRTHQAASRMLASVP